MAHLASLAVFVLATTKPDASGTSYLSTRILPLVSSWGGYFPSTYFVFGTNVEDWRYLSSTSCRLEGAEPIRRKLIARTPQVQSRNSSYVYICKEKNSPSFNVLWTANCTGEYFGYGPVCRCQEAMRFYLNLPPHKLHDWFAFIDDDVYMRPFALSSMLHHFSLNQRKSFPQKEFVLISTRAYRSFQFSKAWTKVGQACNDSRLHNFPVAMPAIISRQAMQALRSAINGNGLTRLQQKWGGSGDAVLGLLLWLFELPVFSFSNSYVEVKAGLGGKHSFRPFKASEIVVVHSVKNMKTLLNRKGRVLALPSQRDVALYCGDVEFINSSVSHTWAAAVSQHAIGKVAANRIYQMRLGNISGTVYKERVSNVRVGFQDFHFQDCQVRA